MFTDSNLRQTFTNKVTVKGGIRIFCMYLLSMSMYYIFGRTLWS